MRIVITVLTDDRKNVLTLIRLAVLCNIELNIW